MQAARLQALQESYYSCVERTHLLTHHESFPGSCERGSGVIIPSCQDCDDSSAGERSCACDESTRFRLERKHVMARGSFARPVRARSAGAGSLMSHAESSC